MHGNFSHAYQLLTTYFQEVKAVDRDFISDIKIEGNRFQKYFWCFGSAKRSYSLLRSIEVIDGTFIKGRYRRTLLTALGVDPCNKLFPLAFAVVKLEKLKAKLTFLRCLALISMDLILHLLQSLTEISDS
ncbi:hypothetical protein GIB67_022888 [Kingdonia uniflora]|uniref:Transposase n=1 Tax=Kingdonia uniflora TaxID=39325 RepID=A0A7J7MW96_9MAGN|nr:hypothetical protein GIB67_022888 [Kingdonia uniflora]